jgi:L-alanine-DL-glutamate epimerase-like enolase superfamily enzyme
VSGPKAGEADTITPKEFGVIEEIQASAYTIPTDAPEADGTLAWDATTLVLVQVRSTGVTGTGWTYGSPACAAVINGLLGPILLGRGPLDIGAAWTTMVIGLRNVGRPGLAGMALSAVDCAMWDLKARLLGLPLHKLLGAVHDTVPVYGSGGFTTYDERQLAAQLTTWVEQGIPRVKIKIGESWGTNQARDLARVREARELVGADVELYVDANGGYTVGQAVRVAADLEAVDVRWFEEPVSSDNLSGLRMIRESTRADVTAGEYGYDLGYFARMVTAAAVDCVQVDVTRCGGITEFLRIGAVVAAHGLQVSGHCAPHLHVAVLSALPNSRHLEWFHDHVRIESMLFDGTLDPSDGNLNPRDDMPGHGLSWRPGDADHWRVG